eukprot:SM000015S01244  [mRNA]  locus=s15:710195:711901:- [translate_table: standard]
MSESETPPPLPPLPPPPPARLPAPASGRRPRGPTPSPDRRQRRRHRSRQLLLALTAAAAAAAAGAATPFAASAATVPKGFSVNQDTTDGYAFLYPFGWQEVSVKGQDVVYKDVIEPLENVSVNIIKTESGSLRDLGPPEQVAKALVERVLTGPTQKPQIVSAKEILPVVLRPISMTFCMDLAFQRETDGKVYYTFEFTSQAPNYKRHALGTIAIAQGKFYTLTTGANERRWPKMQDKLNVVANSFITLY